VRGCDAVLPSLASGAGCSRALAAAVSSSGAILAMAAHLEGRAVKTPRLHRVGAEERRGGGACADAAEESDLDVVAIPLGTADLMLRRIWRWGQVGVLERNARTALSSNMDCGNRGVQARRHPVIDGGTAPTDDREGDRCAALVVAARVRLAERLFGNAQAMNTMLLGLAWRAGLCRWVRRRSCMRSN